MKKLIAFVLIFVLLAPILCTSVQAAIPSTQYSTTTVHILTPSTFNSVFSASSIDEARCTYSTSASSRSGIFNISLLLAFDIGADTYTLGAQGEVDSLVVSSGNTLLEGFVEGNLSVDGISYDALIGFAKMQNSANLQISVTLQPSSGDTPQGIIAFYFGVEVIPQNLLVNTSTNTLEIAQTTPIEESNLVSPYATNLPVTPDPGGLNAGPYVFLDGNLAKFDTRLADVPGTALETKIYYNATTKRLAVCVKSFCYNLENYTSLSNSPTFVDIKNINVDLTMENHSDQNGAYIAGCMRSELPQGSSDGWQRVNDFIDFVEAILSDMDVGSSVISSLFDGIAGQLVTSVETDHEGDNAFFDAQFAISSCPDLDSMDIGMPFEFILATNTPDYTDTTPFVVTVGIVYRLCYLIEPVDGVPFTWVFYIKSHNTSTDIEVLI